MGYKKSPESPLYRNLTLVVTDDCNLQCRYCYQEDKLCKAMNIQTAKDAIDFTLELPKLKQLDGIIYDFIGGEPFLEIDLLDEITEYIKSKHGPGSIYENRFKLNICTNGTHFDNPKVIEYMQKDRCIKWISVSIDGIKEVHDYNRCNSFDTVMKNLHIWRKLYPNCTTKATVNREALPRMAESIKFFVEELGLTYIPINLVFEDIWLPEDLPTYKEQLQKIADYLLSNRRYESVNVTLLQENIGNPTTDQCNWCGCGTSMLTIDHAGDLYPCLRFKSLSNREPYKVGNIYTGGFDRNKLTPFFFCHNLPRGHKCSTCDIATGCARCLASDYDLHGSLFQRSTVLCEFHKIRAEVTKYFFAEINKLERGD